MVELHNRRQSTNVIKWALKLSEASWRLLFHMKEIQDLQLNNGFGFRHISRSGNKVVDKLAKAGVID